MSFVRKHDILIDAPPEAVFDYVCNPHSWPEWLAASHKIEGPDRALEWGQTFREEWQIRRGLIVLNWKVTESHWPNSWTCEADTDFIGPILIRYTFEKVGAGTRYSRQLSNPDRLSDPTEEQLRRMDEEARVGLANIKRHVEKRVAAPGHASNAPAQTVRNSTKTEVTVRIDRDKCQGHARCHALAPELFRLDEFGNAREAANPSVSPDLIEKANIAAANCPEGAIIIQQADPS